MSEKLDPEPEDFSHEARRKTYSETQQKEIFDLAVEFIKQDTSDDPRPLSAAHGHFLGMGEILYSEAYLKIDQFTSAVKKKAFKELCSAYFVKKDFSGITSSLDIANIARDCVNDAILAMQTTELFWDVEIVKL